MNQIDYFWRVTMLGDEGTGKTSLFKRYTIGNTFTGPGIVDTGTRYLKLSNNQTVKLTLVSHPTINQPNFEEIIQNSIKDSVGFILVYDITNPDSLRRCSTFWSPIVRKHASYLNAPLFLLASKTDLLASNVQLRTGSLQLNTIPLKISAKESTEKEVNLLFEYVTSVIHLLMQNDQITPKTSYMDSLPSRAVPSVTLKEEEEEEDLSVNHKFEIGDLQLDGSDEEHTPSHLLELPIHHTLDIDSPDSPHLQ
uniref:Uncharacterized protein n=1 Tax=Arcella intermedia TaxID=1963864 RepID=A0A6B2LF46_9EUKA